MRPLFVAICLLIGSPLGVAAQQAAWKDYVFQDDQFAIAAPAEPSREAQRIRVVGGATTAHIYSVAAGEHGVLMVFVYLRHRSDRRTEREVREQAGSGALRSVKGKLTAQSELALGHYLGSQIDLEAQPTEAARTSHRVRNRFYIVGRRLYQVMAIAPVDEPFPAESERWFKSFRLIRGARRH